MAYVHTFVVEGRGEFPLDMLRYDACYPADGDSVSNMVAEDRAKMTRRVTLRSRVTGPTEGRWSSFMWPVTGPVRKERV